MSTQRPQWYPSRNTPTFDIMLNSNTSCAVDARLRVASSGVTTGCSTVVAAEFWSAPRWVFFQNIFMRGFAAFLVKFVWRFAAVSVRFVRDFSYIFGQIYSRFRRISDHEKSPERVVVWWFGFSWGLDSVRDHKIYIRIRAPSSEARI